MDIEAARGSAADAVTTLNDKLWPLNQKIHQNPELLFQEHIAHDAISGFLEDEGFAVKRSAYGLDTCFEATWSTVDDQEPRPGVRTVTFCAEYDALPDVGHACGHNLIATASVAGFVALVRTLHATKTKPAVRVRLLGTPAEEGGSGKALLLKAGAFPEFSEQSPEIAVMMHPVSHCSFQLQEGLPPSTTGFAGFKCNAARTFIVEYVGKSAHSAGEPWKGVNALDAAVTAYSSIAMVRQHMRAAERVNAIIEHGGSSTGTIPDYTRLAVEVRASTMRELDVLTAKVDGCLKGAAGATGCDVTIEEPTPVYMDMRVNGPLCTAYADEMNSMAGTESVVALRDYRRGVSTDMGNVSYRVPSFHGLVGIPTPGEFNCHDPRFTQAAGTEAAYAAAVRSARGMAMLGWRFVVEDDLAATVSEDFRRV